MFIEIMYAYIYHNFTIFLSLSLSLALCLSFSLSLSLSHTHTHTPSISLSLYNFTHKHISNNQLIIIEGDYIKRLLFDSLCPDFLALVSSLAYVRTCDILPYTEFQRKYIANIVEVLSTCAIPFSDTLEAEYEKVVLIKSIALVI